MGREHISGIVTVIESTHPDYPRLWEPMNGTNNRRYDAFQSKTTRPIPLVAVASNTKLPVGSCMRAVASLSALTAALIAGSARARVRTCRVITTFGAILDGCAPELRCTTRSGAGTFER